MCSTSTREMCVARIRQAAAAGAAVLLLAGCSRGATTATASQPDPSSLLTQATTNAKAADSVHIRGTGECPQGPFVVDMNLLKDQSAAGSVTFSGVTINVVATQNELLLHAPQKFWATQSSPKVAAKIGQKWLRITRTTNPCIDALTSLSNVTANYFGYTGSPVLQKGSSFNGTPATQVGIGTDVAFWIQTRGTLLPINVHDSSTSTDIAMTQWNTDLKVVVPPSTEILDAAVANKA